MGIKYVSNENSEFIELRSWARRKCVQGENCTIAINDLDERKATIHSHPHEQITYFLQGETDFQVGDRIIHARPGDIIVIPPNVPHSGGSSACTMIDFFTPRREDFVECPYTDEQAE